jgi:hypothetical protein
MNAQTADVTYCPWCEVMLEHATTRERQLFGADAALAKHLREVHKRELRSIKLGGTEPDVTEKEGVE